MVKLAVNDSYEFYLLEDRNSPELRLELPQFQHPRQDYPLILDDDRLYFTPQKNSVPKLYYNAGSNAVGAVLIDNVCSPETYRFCVSLNTEDSDKPFFLINDQPQPGLVLHQGSTYYFEVHAESDFGSNAFALTTDEHQAESVLNLGIVGANPAIFDDEVLVFTPLKTGNPRTVVYYQSVFGEDLGGPILLCDPFIPGACPDIGLPEPEPEPDIVEEPEVEKDPVLASSSVFESSSEIFEFPSSYYPSKDSSEETDTDLNLIDFNELSPLDDVPGNDVYSWLANTVMQPDLSDVVVNWWSTENPADVVDSFYDFLFSSYSEPNMPPLVSDNNDETRVDESNLVEEEDTTDTDDEDKKKKKKQHDKNEGAVPASAAVLMFSAWIGAVALLQYAPFCYFL
jgi:hypothetical protein